VQCFFSRYYLNNIFTMQQTSSQLTDRFLLENSKVYNLLLGDFICAVTSLLEALHYFSVRTYCYSSLVFSSGGFFVDILRGMCGDWDEYLHKLSSYLADQAGYLQVTDSSK
jgi:hypothetical protein